jgi:hypothetical protein
VPPRSSHIAWTGQAPPHTGLVAADLWLRDGRGFNDFGVISCYLELNVFDTLIGAEIHAVLGETSRALEWLERAVRNGDERAEWFTRNPALASLRQLPAFQEVVNSVLRRRTG